MYASLFSSRHFFVSRNLYVGAVALTIMFAALFSTSLPGRDLYSAGLHALGSFKVNGVFRIERIPDQVVLCRCSVCKQHQGDGQNAYGKGKTGIFEHDVTGSF